MDELHTTKHTQKRYNSNNNVHALYPPVNLSMINISWCFLLAESTVTAALPFHLVGRRQHADEQGTLEYMEDKNKKLFIMNVFLP